MLKIWECNYSFIDAIFELISIKHFENGLCYCKFNNSELLSSNDHKTPQPDISVWSISMIVISVALFILFN